MSWLHAAGTHITHGHPLHSTAAKEREGKGVVADGEIERVTKLWQRRHKNWKAKKKNHKIMEERKQGRIVERMWGRGRMIGESVCEIPFWTLSRECAVTSHYLIGAAEMQFFPMNPFYAPICTDLTKTIHFSLSLKHTHSHVCFSPSPLCLTSNLTTKKKGKEETEEMKRRCIKIGADVFLFSSQTCNERRRNTPESQPPLPPPCSVISAFNRQCRTSRWCTLTVWKHSL